MLFTFLAVIAVRPAAGLAAPLEPPNLAFEPGSYDFGLQPLYNSAQTNFELHNDGAEGVPVESLGIAGPGSGSFWIGSSNCWGAFLEPGESCSAQVYFNPNDLSEYNAQLQATSSSYQFAANLTGSGASAFFSSDSNPVDFGVAKVGAAGNAREIEVTNAGNWPGGVFIAVISGGAVGSYQILDENCTNREIAPAETCTVQVHFQPLAEGVKKATLSLFGEGDGGTQIVLTGVGSAPDPAPSAPSGPAAAAPGKGKSHKQKRRHNKRHPRRAGVATARISSRGGR